MISFAQIGPEMATNVALPAWAVGTFCFVLVALIGIVGLLLRLQWSTLEKAILSLTASVEALNESLNDHKEKSEKKFVSHSYFDLYRQSVDKEITGIHAAIKDQSDSFETQLQTHKADCPARGMA